MWLWLWLDAKTTLQLDLEYNLIPESLLLCIRNLEVIRQIYTDAAVNLMVADLHSRPQKCYLKVHASLVHEFNQPTTTTPTKHKLLNRYRFFKSIQQLQNKNNTNNKNNVYNKDKHFTHLLQTHLHRGIVRNSIY